MGNSANNPENELTRPITRLRIRQDTDEELSSLTSDSTATQYYRESEGTIPVDIKSPGKTQTDIAPEISPQGTSFLRSFVGETLQIVVPALLLAFIIHIFLAQATVVYGRSMEPSLIESQRLIIDKLSYRFRTPQRNDIVVLNIPTMNELLVKRIVGLPGETIEIRNGIVYINNESLDESYPHYTLIQDMEPVLLGPLNYFVLGDNRENSNDSRAFGAIRYEYIVGRVWLRYWPLHQIQRF
ncbi:signal peptidase I [Chloroflexi bacterium TSY]|nr:signal peptidase I [Chloroflexi bacterium TSY]